MFKISKAIERQECVLIILLYGNGQNKDCFIIDAVDVNISFFVQKTVGNILVIVLILKKAKKKQFCLFREVYVL